VTAQISEELTAARLNDLGAGMLPGHLGIRIESVSNAAVEATLEIRAIHLAPNGFLHAAAVVALADTATGYGCARSLPPGASGFTTAELKANFLGTATAGGLRCTASLLHGGRTTQVWDATVQDEDSRTIAVFRCTQIVLWPRGG
jgi:1,4-dihydroxy-2-naphthoyl-CoA hydrolase